MWTFSWGQSSTLTYYFISGVSLTSKAQVQGRTGAEVCGGSGTLSEAAAQRLPMLFELLAKLIQGRWFKQVEHLCTVLRSVRGLPWLSACVATWPLEVASLHNERMVCSVSRPI